MLFLRSLRKIAPRACTPVFRYNAPQLVGLFQNYSSSHGLDKAQIKERVIELLECFDKVNQEKLNAEAHFKKDLGLDSLDTVEVLMALEEEFQLEIPDHDADEIKTVKDMIEYISLRGEAI